MTKIQSLFFLFTLSLLSAVAVPEAGQAAHAQNNETLSPASKGTPVLKKKSVDDAVAQYEQASDLEKKTYRELITLEDRLWEIKGIQRQAESLKQSFKRAQDAAKSSSKAFPSLSEGGQTSFSARDVAIETANTYITSADEALHAIADFVETDISAVDGKANLADAATNTKTELKQRARESVQSSKDASREWDTLLRELLKYEENRRKLLGKVQKYRSEITRKSNNLKSKTKKDTQLGRATHSSLTTLLRDVQPLARSSAEINVQEQESFAFLSEGLTKLQKSEKSLANLLAKYLESIASTVVLKESHFFLLTLQQQNAGDESLQAELATSAESLAVSLAEVESIKKNIIKQSTVVHQLLDALVSRYETLPYALKEIDQLIIESTRLATQFSDTVRVAKEALSAKTTEYEIARKAADELYTLAYGHQRLSEYSNSERYAYAMLESQTKSAVMEVVDHVYVHVYTLKEEPEGYGAYTYVLFRQNYPGAQDHIEKRYKALLNTIYRSTSSIQDFSADISKKKLNLFCIPYKSYTKDNEEVEGYDANLARSYLATASGGAILKRDIIKRIAKSPGPFLLTTRTKLSLGSSQKQLLFVDLSLYPPDAFDSILTVYKNTIVEYPPENQEVWAPPVMQRIVYFGVSTSNALPALASNIGKIVGFLVPTARANQTKP